MDKKEYIEFLNNYKSEHSVDFCAVHDAHNSGLTEPIMNNGLCVSHNPYGKKIRNCQDENGNIDLNRAFMATFIEISDKNSWLGAKPVSPVFINIPEKLLDKMKQIQGNEFNPNDLYKEFCGYGFEQLSENDGRGNMTPVENSSDANIRLMPAYLIDGCLDMENGEYRENPNSFKNLSKEIQDKILQEIENGNAKQLAYRPSYEGYPTIEKVPPKELEGTKKELFGEEPEIVIDRKNKQTSKEQIKEK